MPVEPNGLVSLTALEAALTESTLLVSVMAAHNEIGVIQPLAEIGALCRAKGTLFHSDAAQAFGKIPLDVEAMKIDLLSISGHKIYGPKGVGALYVRRRPRVRLLPLIDGGGQERGLRSGTLPTPLCVGIGRAAAIAADEMEDEAVRLRRFRDRLWTDLARRVPGLRINGDAEHRLPGSLNFGFPGIAALELIEACPGIAISTGSACTSASVEPSYVLRALGLSQAEANSGIRIGLGRFTTAAEVDFAIDAALRRGFPADAARRRRTHIRAGLDPGRGSDEGEKAGLVGDRRRRTAHTERCSTNAASRRSACGSACVRAAARGSATRSNMPTRRANTTKSSKIRG